MSTLSRRTFLAVTGAAGAAAACGTLPATITQPNVAQDGNPNRPVRLIVPAPAGSRTDIVGRTMGPVLEKALGQPLHVVNPEGSSADAHAAIAAAAPDGHTLGLITVDIATMHWRGLTQLRHTDYTPLALMSEDPAGVHVKSQGPWKEARELVAHIRANPGKLKVSGVGRGGIWHLSTVGWLTAAGLGADAMEWVPSNGPAPALANLAIGGVDVVVCSVPEVRATPDARTTRSLAVMAGQRHPRYPEVPTLREAIGVSYSASAWRGVAAPKGLPPETASKLTAALKKTWDSKEFKDEMARRGFRTIWGDAAQFAAFLEGEDRRMGTTVQAARVAKG